MVQAWGDQHTAPDRELQRLNVAAAAAVAWASIGVDRALVRVGAWLWSDKEVLSRRPNW